MPAKSSAVSSTRQISGRAALARGWEMLATDPQNALREVEEAGPLFARGAADEAFQEEAQLLRGCALTGIGRYAEARAILQPALRPDEVRPPTRPQLRALIALGTAELRLGHEENSLALLLQAHAQAAGIGDLEMEGYALMYTGIAHNELGHHAEAVSMLAQALERFIACGDRRGIALTRGNLGNTHFALEEYAQAAEYYLAGLRTLRELGDRRGQAVGLGSLGCVYLQLGDAAKGIDCYRRANDEFHALGLVLEETLGWEYTGQALLQTGAWAEAADAFRQALALAEPHQLAASVGAALFGLGEAAAGQGEPAAAADAFGRALRHTADQGEWIVRANGLLSLARARRAAPTLAAWTPLPAVEVALAEAIRLGNERSLPAVVREAGALLARHCEEQGDTTAALGHLKEHQRLQEAFWQEKAKRAVARAEVFYTVEQHRREAELAQAHAQELEKALAEARRQHERAELESRMKSELLGIVAHDLRNSLFQVNLAVEMIRTDLTNPKLIGNCDDINSAIRRAERLIRSLLDRAALEEGRLALEPMGVDLSEHARIVWRQSVGMARRKDQTLQLVAEGPCRAYADAQRVEQVLQNLVDNAIKFTPRGKTITLTAHPGGEVARLSVHDEGLGMDNEDLARVFERFAKLSARPTGEESSTGLGLSITKQLVEAMGGRVWVESAGKGLGCTFWVELPASPPAGKSPA
jgi:signal transduction histidine kinase